MKKPFRMLAVCTALSLLPWAGARAQTTGVTAKEIVIGSCAALEGPSSFLGRETVRGAEIYFQYINDEGGVLGRKLRLVSRDDSYDPTKAQACWDRLMEEKVFAMGFFVGTPTALKYVPLAESNQVPLVGLFTGAQTLYTPVRHWVINVRASYFDETAEQVDGLWSSGIPQNCGDLSRRCVWRSGVAWSAGGTERAQRGAGGGSFVPATVGDGGRSD